MATVDACFRRSDTFAATLSPRRLATLVSIAATRLASLSPDVRTPLTAIKGAVENLRGDLPPDDRDDGPILDL